MEFRNKVSDYATMDKKGNMAYWDAIDGLTEDYLRALLEFSQSPLKLVDDHEDEDDVFLRLGKEVAELAIKMLEDNFSAHFPYVDENY